MSVNANQKGKRVERAVAVWLQKAGFISARRTQQYCGTEGTSDVVCPELSNWHIESKGVKSALLTQSKLRTWVQQVRNDCPAGQSPVIIITPNGGDHFAMLPLDMFLKLFRNAHIEYEVVTSPSFNVITTLTEKLMAQKIIAAICQDTSPNRIVIATMIDNSVWIITTGNSWLKAVKHHEN